MQQQAVNSSSSHNSSSSSTTASSAASSTQIGSSISQQLTPEEGGRSNATGTRLLEPTNPGTDQIFFYFLRVWM
jgi:hypothetical protein